jgi:CubicO group peptidase (beta-lactamase class C family)
VVSGEVAGGYEPVREAAARVLEGQGGGGLAVAAFVDGRPVVDLWGGTVAEDGLVHTWSACKPVVGACLLLLVERGRVQLDQPVQDLWPELRAPATIRDVVSHRAGLVTLPGTVADLMDWDATCAGLAAAEPDWVPGMAVGEHALTYGHLVGELVRRVDGRRLGRFLADELGLDIAIGVSDTSRVADLVGVTPEWWARLRGPAGGLRHRALGDGMTGELVNSDAWRRAEVPAVNAHASARGLAAFWQRLLDGTLPASVAHVGAEGHDLVLDAPATWTLSGGRLDGPDVGMGGIGGQWAAARPSAGLAWAFLTTVMGDFDRAERVEAALLGCRR